MSYQLFTAIMTTCGVSLSSDNLAKVAAMIGPQCTAKAITHRIAKIKANSKTTAGDTDGTVTPSTTPKKRGPAASKVKTEDGESPPKKPRAPRVKGGKKSSAKVKSEDEDDAGEGAKSVTPASMKDSGDEDEKVKEEEQDDNETAEQQIQLENDEV